MQQIGLVVVLAISLAIATGASSAEAGDDGELRSTVRGAGLVPYWSFKPIKDFSYPEVNAGRPVSIREFDGKVAVVNLWATWCPPCVREMPSLERLHDQFHRQGLVVLGININDRMDVHGVRKWLGQRNLTFLNLKGDSDGPPLVSSMFVPQTFIIDKRGRLIANGTGDHDWSDNGMQQLVRYMLGTAD
jgi:thiol-disulfide isomerase/thioredoxin